MSKIEELIGEIEEYIDNCKFYPLSNSKIIVVKEELEELLSELRQRTPEEIKKYQKIISNQEAILNDAKKQANSILAEVTEQTNELINEHEIMQRAYAQANEIVMQAGEKAQEIIDSAVNDANNIRYSSVQYTDEMLGSLQTIISHSMNDAQSKFNQFLGTMNSNYEIISANRTELRGSEEEEEESQEMLKQA